MRPALALTALAALPLLATAQVSTYQFSQSQQTYTEITAADGGYVLGAPAAAGSQFPNNPKAYLDPMFPGGIAQNQLAYFTDYSGTLRSGFPIGFNFSFNGDVFDRIGISENGWISFGKSSDGVEAVWCYASRDGGPAHGDPFVQSAFTPPGPVPNYKRDRVAGFGNSGMRMRDWSNLVPPGPVSALRMATIGTAPNRICVVQWKDFGLAGDYGTSYNTINFQIRLNEADNSVDVRFGPMNWDHLLGRRTDTQVGLAGRTSDDFNGRVVVYQQPAFLYDWNNTAPAMPADTTNANMVYCTMAQPAMGQPNGSGVLPAVGLNWRWVAPVCPPPAWPLLISNISFDSATASWVPTGSGEFEYFLTDTNSVTGPEVTSGTTTDPEISLFGLDPLTDYYLFIRQICNGEPGVWSMATHFRTLGGAAIVCDGSALDVTYCSHQYDTIDWMYTSVDGSPLRIDFFDGWVGSVSGESFTIWDGVPPPEGSGNQLFHATSASNLNGVTKTSTTGVIYMRLTTGAGACGAQDWYLPFHWKIGCKNCSDPLVNFTMGNIDCDNNQFYVAANVFSMGSTTSLVFTNNVGAPTTTVTTTGGHTVGPYPNGAAVIVTAQNPNNAMCYSNSTPFITPPCPTVGCGPTTYSYCYDNDEHRTWAYQGAGGQQIGIRFLQGGVGLGDHAYMYNGLDIANITPDPVPDAMANSLFTSSTADHALVLELVADHQYSCATPGMFGAVQEWKYVVACYDGCVQPKATFTDSCISTTAFLVKVKVTDLGSTGSVQITSSSGAPAITATAVGTYLAGPFQSTVPVTINVEGASILCTWTSANRSKDCSGWSGVGIHEEEAASMRIFPNPSNGTFQLELPQALNHTARVQVMDLTGRVVAQELARPGSTTLHLEHLPNGLYTVMAEGNDMRFTAKISIQH